jgi:hypothetical protein
MKIKLLILKKLNQQNQSIQIYRVHHHTGWRLVDLRVSLNMDLDFHHSSIHKPYWSKDQRFYLLE